MIQELGGDVFAYRVGGHDAAVGHMVKELGLPRDALVNLIVRSGEALPPRGSTVIEGGDELHLLVRREARGKVGELIEAWRDGPVGEPPLPELGVEARPRSSRSGPTGPEDGDPGAPTGSPVSRWPVCCGRAATARPRSRPSTTGDSRSPRRI